MRDSTTIQPSVQSEPPPWLRPDPYAVRLAADGRFEVYHVASGRVVSTHEHGDAAHNECNRLCLGAGPTIDLSATDLAWLAEHGSREEWWLDIGRDAIADSCGDFGPEPPDWTDLDLERYEAETIDRHLRARDRSDRVSDLDQPWYGAGRLRNGYVDRP